MMRVLLVEDNHRDARRIQEMIREVGTAKIELTHAERLDEALKCLEGDSFDTVLLDLGLPDSQGIDTFNSVNSVVRDVPIVMLSGLEDENLAIKTVQNGAQDYLLKGKVDIEMLMRSIRYAIERKQAEMQITRYIKRVEALNAVSQTASQSLDLQEIMDTTGF